MFLPLIIITLAALLSAPQPQTMSTATPTTAVTDGFNGGGPPATPPASP